MATFNRGEQLDCKIKFKLNKLLIVEECSYNFMIHRKCNNFTLPNNKCVFSFCNSNK